MHYHFLTNVSFYMKKLESKETGASAPTRTLDIKRGRFVNVEEDATLVGKKGAS